MVAQMEQIFQQAQRKRDMVFKSNEAALEAKAIQDAATSKRIAEETWASIDG